MKLSELNAQQLKSLTEKQKTDLIFGFYHDDKLCYDAVILLGGISQLCKERAKAAAQLFKLGRVKTIIASGGVVWDSPFGSIPEAEIMKNYLMELGVPEHVILTETNAKSTVENMICSTLLIQRSLCFDKPLKISVVSSFWHLRRAYMLARVFLPSCARISCWHGENINVFDSPEHWQEDELHQRRVDKEIRMLKSFYDNGIIEDFEF